MPRALTFQPKIFTFLKKYDLETFVSDLVAGTVVGIVALPLAIAFGIASGVSPEKGLITAVVAGFLISALGGSRVQIGGPTGAFIVIVYGIVYRYGVDGLTGATLLAGCLLVLLGLSGLGGAIRFVPRAVVTGFTAGIALIIFTSQIKDMLGLPVQALPAEFAAKMELYAAHLGGSNLYALALGSLTVLTVIFWNRFFKRFPGSLVAILAASAAAALFHFPVETIGSRFGELPHRLPLPQVPSMELSRVKELLPPAMTIALLAAIESLLSAVVADKMAGTRHRPNTELIAQGIANMGSAVFGGIPATGAIARTATNVKNGAKTPIAGIVHALVLLLILFFFGRWARLIPLACLAGILFVVAYHMSEWRAFVRLLRGGGHEAFVLAVTFVLTVFVDLTAAIAAGTAVSFAWQFFKSFGTRAK